MGGLVVAGGISLIMVTPSDGPTDQTSGPNPPPGQLWPAAPAIDHYKAAANKGEGATVARNEREGLE